MFEDAIWQEDRMTLNGLLFSLEHNRSKDAAPVEADHFRFLKPKGLVDQYEQFLRAHPLDAQNVLELGMWDGGSLALWFEGLRPRKMVGIDIEDRLDSPYFRRYVQDRKLDGKISTYWKTNQADRRTLREIVRREFAEPIDLVFDDASHLYGPTKASFETIFPSLRTGGIYFIEDWAWRHWRESQFPLPKQWSPTQHLSRLVTELVEVTGTGNQIISEVYVHHNFVGVRRGSTELSASFRLDDYIYRRPEPMTKRVLTRLLWGPEREALWKVKKKIIGR